MYFMSIEHREALHGTRIRESEAAVSTNHPETAASVTIVQLGYRARCTEPACRNLGRLILRYEPQERTRDAAQSRRGFSKR
jgi:hypothetical protein